MSHLWRTAVLAVLLGAAPWQPALAAEPPADKFWNLTSATYWHESQNYLTQPVSLTLDEVTKRPDGTVRFILTDKDPGLPNWIRTFQHNCGFLIMRMVRVEANPVPTITRVKFADLGRYK